MGIFDSYPKVDFIEGITAEKLEAEMLSAFQRKRKELTGVDEVIPQSDSCYLRLLPFPCLRADRLFWKDGIA